MNSLNILSSRVISQAASISRPRSRSQGEALTSKQSEEILRGRSYSDENVRRIERKYEFRPEEPGNSTPALDEAYDHSNADVDEKTPLVENNIKSDASIYRSRLKSLVKKIADVLTALLATIGSPAFYVVRCFQDEEGVYSALLPLKRIKIALAGGSANKSTATAFGLSHAPEAEIMESEKSAKRTPQESNLRHSYSSESLRSTTSESESDRRQSKHPSGLTRSHRQRPDSTVDDLGLKRQSIRIKLHSEDAPNLRRLKKSSASDHSVDISPPLTVDTIKSPTSPSPSLKVTRYPHAPHPPRPLTPRRQPSYSSLILRSPVIHAGSPHLHHHHHPQKTLVLDLDETLIHSLAKGGRMSSGHMVEVKLNAPVALSPVTQAGPQQAIPILGPQHPILYYVHKRPHCEEFLRKVCKWFKLVVFTASVQEYADPVIDWLEQERKYFAGRYYRQHCTFRNGAYIKDLSSVEPDLSKVIILDNSPVSYIFHEDNAIPIEGWINDPTDNDLLHLIPMLEALQYVTDVRALLALRRGEAGAI